MLSIRWFLNYKSTYCYVLLSFLILHLYEKYHWLAYVNLMCYLYITTACKDFLYRFLIKNGCFKHQNIYSFSHLIDWIFCHLLGQKIPGCLCVWGLCICLSVCLCVRASMPKCNMRIFDINLIPNCLSLEWMSHWYQYFMYVSSRWNHLFMICLPNIWKSLLLLGPNEREFTKTFLIPPPCHHFFTPKTSA